MLLYKDTLRALQISQNGGYLISCILFVFHTQALVHFGRVETNLKWKENGSGILGNRSTTSDGFLMNREKRALRRRNAIVSNTGSLIA